MYQIKVENQVRQTLHYRISYFKMIAHIFYKYSYYAYATFNIQL